MKPVVDKIVITREEAAEALGIAPDRLTLFEVVGAFPMMALNIQIDGSNVIEPEHVEKLNQLMQSKAAALGGRVDVLGSNIGEGFTQESLERVSHAVAGLRQVAIMSILCHATGLDRPELQKLARFCLGFPNGKERLNAKLDELAVKNHHSIEWDGGVPVGVVCPKDEAPS